MRGNPRRRVPVHSSGSEGQTSPSVRPANSPVANAHSSPVSHASPMGSGSWERSGNRGERSRAPQMRGTKIGASRAGARPERLVPEFTWPLPPWQRIFRGAAALPRCDRSRSRRKAGCSRACRTRRRARTTRCCFSSSTFASAVVSAMPLPRCAATLGNA